MIKSTIKKITLCALILISVLTLGACSSLPDGVDEEKLKNSAYDIITMLDEGRYDEVYALFRSDVAQTVDADNLRDTLEPVLSSIGSFTQIKRERYKTQTSEEGEEYLLCQITVEYSDGAATFGVGFDYDYTLIGISVLTR